MVVTISGATAIAQEDDPGAYRLGSIQTSRTSSGMRLLSTPFYPTDYTHNPVYDDCILLDGIDVSKYQGDIDWEKAKAAGVEFAFIRVGYRGYGAGGNFGADTYYDQNMQGAIAAGIPVGVYFFSQATTQEEAIEEANYILERIGNYKISMPLVMDFEYASASGGQTGRLYDAKLSKQDATNVCLAFCDTIKASGYTPMVYANLTMLQKGLYADQIQANYDIWLANYTNETSYTGLYSFWQYTSKGTVNGIKGSVDCNFWYKKTPDKVAGLTAGNRSDTDITLQWDTSNGAQGYQIYRSTTPTGNFERVASVSGEAISVSGESINVYIDSDTTPATSYYYKVRGYLKFNGTNYFGGFSNVFNTFTLPSSVGNVTAKPTSTSSITLKWDKVDESDGYRIFRYDNKTGEFVKLVTLSGNRKTTYIHKKLSSASNYQYKVYSFTRINNTARFSTSSEIILSSPLPTKVTNLSVGGKTSSRIRLNWEKVSGATGYQIYYYNKSAKKYTKLMTISSQDLTYVCTNLKASTEYKFKVRAYKRINGANYFGSCSSILRAKTAK